MKRTLTVLLIAGAIAAVACSDRDAVSRPLGLSAAADSTRDSMPPGKPGPVASVTVSPPSDTVAVGDSVGFFASLQDANGIPISDSHVKWSVADPTVARIEGVFGQSLLLRALHRGGTTVTAKFHGKSGSAQLVVLDSLPPPPPPPSDSVATVTVTPDSAIVIAGDTANFFATLRDANGNILSGRSVSWTVSDSAVASIQVASGQSVVVRALKSGSTFVIASSEGKSGSGTLFVR